VAMNNPAWRFVAFFRNPHTNDSLHRHKSDKHPHDGTRHEPLKRREFVAALSLALRFLAMGQSASRCCRILTPVLTLRFEAEKEPFADATLWRSPAEPRED